MVILPSLLLTQALVFWDKERAKTELYEEAHRAASLHAMYLQSFISETIGRMESLALLITSQNGEMDQIMGIITKVHHQDPRFSGFYWVQPSGEILISSNPMNKEVNLLDRNYFQKVLETGSTYVSKPHVGRVTGRIIVSIATPIVSENEITGVLVGSLRLDAIERYLKQFAGEETIQVRDENGQWLIMNSDTAADIPTINAEVNTQRVSWIVRAGIPDLSREWYIQSYLFYFFVTLILIHILYTLMKYQWLKRQLKLEKLQNDAQKLELIGSLAASTAHEIRNPLTGIKGLTTLLSEKYDDEKDQFYFSIIQQEINRINAIVSELLVLGKPTIQTVENYDLHSILSEITPIIESEANLYNVELHIQMVEEPLPITCSKDHIKQVLLNISKNALEAMPNGGCLTITSGLQKDHAKVEISDTGNGIPPEVMERIFDPFFTSKKNGTGLGLVVCKRILDMYGGTISITGTSEKGTSVGITLPLTKEKD
ncbi:ATP-binding protein [Ammoniphilus resinae]|uniref:ATP-binding protein n=1 Tax=Ammoniphilus resinae TaxID=861532 RepID=UPI001AE38AD9|nr:ATP-binding protein [Ammoniphilus resinae]